MKIFIKTLIGCLFLTLLIFSFKGKITTKKNHLKDFTIQIPCEGNSWVKNNYLNTKKIIKKGGIKNWIDKKDKIRTYFYANTTGEIEVGIEAHFIAPITLKITLGKKTYLKTFSPTKNYEKISVGVFKIEKLGYNFIELEKKENNTTPININNILLGDSSWKESITYIKPDWFYWGRRGPSVHLSYEVPSENNVTWFYNEVTIPKGKDPIGSYFMVNGFSDGYFGIQVNSETERRVLFSVWSPYDTQDPTKIPEDYKVKTLKTGKNVYDGKFGDEGSGAQSYLKFNWQPETTYKFLLKGESNLKNTIDYTAYFYSPENKKWNLIASFRRPHSKIKSLKRLYSFVENFDTTTGNLDRKAAYTNQWVFTNNQWQEITSAIFTIDNTGNKKVRLDYNGASEGEKFFLSNGGFLNKNLKPKTILHRSKSSIFPKINFKDLEN